MARLLSHRGSALVATLALLLLPGSAAAYLTPEEVLFRGAGYTTLKPPSHRETGDKIDEQMRTSDERRRQEQKQNYLNQHPPVSEPEPEEEAAEETSEEPTLEDVLSSLQESIDRLSEEREAGGVGSGDDEGMTIANWEDPTRVRDNDDVLHSGAPLTPTGAETWVALAAVMGAVGYTFWRARKAVAHVKS